MKSPPKLKAGEIVLSKEVLSVLSEMGLSESSFDQEEIIQFLKNPLSHNWVTVYAHHSVVEDEPSVFACFANTELGNTILQGDNWTKHAGSFQPGFWMNAEGVHYANGKEEGYDFLIAETYFHTYDECQLYVNQEFVMLFELYRGEDGCYYSIGECGEKEKVVDVAEGFVRVRTKYILRYIAAKQCLFVYFMDSRFASSKHYPYDADLIDDYDEIGENYHFKRCFQSTKNRDYLLSMLYSRSFVNPGPREDCKIWPYDSRDESYPEFTIGELPDGTPAKFTCNPDKLGTYFDKERTAPHYLTPVYFGPSVLDKYRNNPLFKVTDRRLECGSQWGVEIDNVNPERVMVYLGDLGRDVPESERQHFLSFQISPVDQHISKEVFLNDFMCMFTDSSGPISKLMVARRTLDETWTMRYNRPLYREFHENDREALKQIRIPAENSEAEFDTIIMALAKVFIDYIDESQFPPSDKPGSINNLEVFLNDEGFDISLQALRDLQKMRSSGAAHSKGSNYEKIRGALITSNHKSDVAQLISRLTNLVREIADQLSNEK